MPFKKRKYLDTNDLTTYAELSVTRFLINRYKTTQIVHEDFLINTIPEEDFVKFIEQHFTYITHNKKECYGCVVTIDNTNTTGTFNNEYNRKWIMYDPNKKYWNISITAINQHIIDRVKALFKPYIPEEYKAESIPEINFIAQADGALYLKPINLKKVDIDLEQDYSTNMPLKNVEDLVKSESGLYILTGLPGTGKSYFIRYLASLGLQTVVVQQNQIHLLTEPAFQEFAFSELKDTLLILEDCEKVLEDRNKGGNSNLTSIMLNLTDGILNEALNIKVVVTLNTMENIDPALLRVGRLRAFVEFNKLPTGKANAIANRLGSKTVYTEPVELSKIYNTKNTGKEEVVKSTIGFNK